MRRIAPLKLRAAVAAQAAQQIAGEAFRMQPHQRRRARLRLADHDRQMLDRPVFRAEGDDAGIGGVIQRHRRLRHLPQSGGGTDAIASTSAPSTASRPRRATASSVPAPAGAASTAGNSRASFTSDNA